MATEEAPTRPDETRPREHLANERTLLAWSRTAVTLIALGFAVSRFDVFLRELRMSNGRPGGPSAAFSAAIGLVFVLAGLLTAGVGVVRFLHGRRQIEAARFEAPLWPYLLLTVLMCAIGVALIVYLIVDVARS